MTIKLGQRVTLWNGDSGKVQAVLENKARIRLDSGVKKYCSFEEIVSAVDTITPKQAKFRAAKEKLAAYKKDAKKLTKQQVEKFTDDLTTYMSEIGATPIDRGTGKSWQVSTTAGNLTVSIHDDEVGSQVSSIFAKFDDPKKASEIVHGSNPYSGKWNFHTSDPVENLEIFKNELNYILGEPKQMESQDKTAGHPKETDTAYAVGDLLTPADGSDNTHQIHILDVIEDGKTYVVEKRPMNDVESDDQVYGVRYEIPVSKLDKDKEWRRYAGKKTADLDSTMNKLKENGYLKRLVLHDANNTKVIEIIKDNGEGGYERWNIAVGGGWKEQMNSHLTEDEVRDHIEKSTMRMNKGREDDRKQPIISSKKTAGGDKVRCNNCDNVYDEEDLKVMWESDSKTSDAKSIKTPHKEPDDSYISVCPECETDEYLMDVQEAAKKTAAEEPQYIGEDDWNRGLYKYKGQTYVDVDGELYTMTSDYGEPISGIGVDTPDSRFDRMSSKKTAAEERKIYTTFSKFMKSALEPFMGGVPYSVQTSGSTRPNPYIRVFPKGGIVPNSFRKQITDALGITALDEDDIHYGNITSNYLALNYSQWVTVLNALGVALPEGTQASKKTADRWSMKKMEDFLAEKNQEDGTAFELGGTYGNYELWANGNRLESGSLDDVYQAWIKNRFNEKYKKASKKTADVWNESDTTLKKGIIEMSDSGSYEGYYVPERKWNGWIIPYFSKEVSEQVLKDISTKYESSMYEYVEAEDAFYFTDDTISDNYDKTDVWLGTDINTEDGVKHLYSIGGQAWTWELAVDGTDVEASKRAIKRPVRKSADNNDKRAIWQERLSDIEAKYPVATDAVTYFFFNWKEGAFSDIITEKYDRIPNSDDVYVAASEYLFDAETFISSYLWDDEITVEDTEEFENLMEQLELKINGILGEEATASKKAIKSPVRTQKDYGEMEWKLGELQAVKDVGNNVVLSFKDCDLTYDAKGTFISATNHKASAVNIPKGFQKEFGLMVANVGVKKIHAAVTQRAIARKLGGRDTTPKYRVETNSGESMAWKKEYGKPTLENIEKWVDRFNSSLEPGGVNEHVGQGSFIYKAKVINQKTGEIMAEWEGSPFITSGLSTAARKKVANDMSDEDIASSYEGYIIESAEMKPSGQSGWIYLTFPQDTATGDSSSGGGFIIYDSGKVAFDNWYPEPIYLELSNFIKDVLTEKKEVSNVSQAEVQKMLMDKGYTSLSTAARKKVASLQKKADRLGNWGFDTHEPVWVLEAGEDGKKKIKRNNA